MGKRPSTKILRGKNADWLAAVVEVYGAQPINYIDAGKVIYSAFGENITHKTLPSWVECGWADIVTENYDAHHGKHLYRIKNVMIDRVKRRYG